MSPSVNRWLTLNNSWKERDVTRLLRFFTKYDVVVDPFVGVGTTGVVATQKGCRAILADISPIAYLSTKTKLYLPEHDVVLRCQEILRPGSLSKIVDLFSSAKLPNFLDPALIEPLLFILSASYLRANFHKEIPFSIELLQKQIARLLYEMELNLRKRNTLKQSALIFLADFSEIHTLLHTRNIQDLSKIVLTSPPFFGSNINPKKQKLEETLAFNLGINPPVNKYDFTKESDYMEFLSKFVLLLHDLHAQGAGIELGGKYLGRKLRGFENELIVLIKELGYSVVKRFRHQKNDEVVITLIMNR